MQFLAFLLRFLLKVIRKDQHKKILQKIKEYAEMQFLAFLLRFLLKVIRKDQLKKIL